MGKRAAEMPWSVESTVVVRKKCEEGGFREEKIGALDLAARF